MAIHTFRYRYTAEVEIAVDDSKAGDDTRAPDEIATDALEVHGGNLIDNEHFEDEVWHLGGVGTGITGTVTKIPTWDHI
ncbi:hypothetical protein [Solidesulfovibrio sp.]